MEPYLESIDPDRNLIEAFVADYHRHGLVDVDTLVWPRENIGKPTFYFHEDTFEPPIAEEIRGPFKDAYYLLSRIPLMPEMTDPTFAGLLQTWVEYIVKGSLSQSWNAAWTAHVIVHFYRRITTPEYQTQAHMQIVYAVSAAFDIATSSTILVDDRLDQCDARDGCTTWHTRHAVTFPTDTGVLFAIGKRALRFLVPDSHPFKWKILSLYDDYQEYCLSYLSVAGARLQRAPCEDIRQKLFYSVDSVTPETYRAFSWMRSGYYNTVMREACRLLACYSSVIATKSHRQLYFDVIARGNGVMCVLDDIRDSRALNIELPNRSIRGPLDEYLQYVKPEIMLDFLPGETHQTFLLASLELARGESKAMTLGEDEKSEIFAILVDCYWPKEQGLEEDPKVKESRIRRLCAMFLKYNLLKYNGFNKFEDNALIFSAF